MKQLSTLLILLSISTLASAQVTYRQAPKGREVLSYDSLTNMPDRKIGRMAGYDMLILSNQMFYSQPDSRTNAVDYTNYKLKEDIKQQTYTFKRVFANEKRHEVWITFANATDSVFYQVTEGSLENPSFLTLAFFEKQKECIGKIFTPNTQIEYTELNSGEIRKYDTDIAFTCTELTIMEEEGYLIPSYILKSPKGDEIAVPLRDFERNSSKYVGRFVIE
ncbi:MAG: hypothetical protein ACK5L5_08540 [Bacteroidales bacterium]